MSFVAPSSCDVTTPQLRLNDHWDEATWIFWTAPPNACWEDARTQGFWKLYDAIKRHKQPMTTPVLVKVQDPDGSDAMSRTVYTIMFKVANSLQLTSVDTAEDVLAVRIPQMRVHTYTSHRLFGYKTEDECRSALDRLKKCGQTKDPSVWYAAFYDPPYRLWKKSVVIVKAASDDDQGDNMAGPAIQHQQGTRRRRAQPGE
jgi:hypothetical protein